MERKSSVNESQNLHCSVKPSFVNIKAELDVQQSIKGRAMWRARNWSKEISGNC
jgi:hypothetical protein